MDGDKMRNNNGFTLIETMVAMTVLLIGILGVMGMQYYAITGNASSRELRVATTLTSELLVQLIGTPYTNMVAMGDGTEPSVTAADYGGNDFSFTAATGGMVFTRSWWIEGGCSAMSAVVDDQCGANGNNPTCAAVTTAPISMIRARTCWTDKNGTDHSVTMTRKRTNLL
jgi:prepilin-type N-terminal cleavage/methylation domain-containing protein